MKQLNKIEVLEVLGGKTCTCFRQDDSPLSELDSCLGDRILRGVILGFYEKNIAEDCTHHCCRDLDADYCVFNSKISWCH